MSDDVREPQPGADPPAAASTKRPTPRRRWWRAVAVVVLVLSLLVNGVLLFSGGGKVGAWRAAEGKAEYEKAYATVLASMPPPVEERYVRTRYGTAHVLRFGDASDTPILLMPGWGSGIPMWQENLPALVKDRTVYAFDAVGDAGLSIQDVPFESTADEAAWVAETVQGLGLDQVHLVGHSFGGRIAAEVAVRHPERVATLSLLEPAQTFAWFPAEFILWSIPAQIPLLPQSWRDAALARIGGVEEIDPNDPMTALIDAGTKHYSPQRVLPQPLSDEEIAALTMPVYVAIGGASTAHSDVAKAVERARTVPRASVQVYESGTHSLPMEQPDQIGAELLAFAAARDRSRP